MTNADIVRASMEAYRSQDREAADRIMADDLTFTSPQDDHIDRAAWFETCFPTADRNTSHRTLEVVEVGDDGVLVLYEYELTTGEVYRNTELHTVRDGQVHEVQVFFGGRVR